MMNGLFKFRVFQYCVVGNRNCRIRCYICRATEESSACSRLTRRAFQVISRRLQ